MSSRAGKHNLLRDARVYLSGPMDFVASRAAEKKHGWRNRVGEFLRELGATVFDPWFKPEVRGFHEYGHEGEATTRDRERWTFRKGPEGARARASCAEKFWPSLHIDLRMVDTSDFVISYCPTNLYSVGTPHEIILCRQERKPVLFVSPHVDFPSLSRLERYLEKKLDRAGLRLLERLKSEVPIKPNPEAVPSLWYMPLVGGEHFFDGFGFEAYRKALRWRRISLDDQEAGFPPKKPLLPFLEQLNERLPKKWDRHRDRFVVNDDWLLWDLKRTARRGAQVRAVHQGRGTRR
jgi:hypothetical protein